MRKTTRILWAGLAAAAVALAAASCAPKAEKKAAAGAAGIIFLDRNVVLRESSAGKDLYAQTETLAMQMESDFKPENTELQADVTKLQTQATLMSPDVRQAKIRELEARRQAFQNRVKARQEAIQAGQAKARAQIEEALTPILNKIMTERSATLLLDRSLVILGATDNDVTSTVVERLNTSLPKVTVTLTTQP